MMSAPKGHKWTGRGKGGAPQHSEETKIKALKPYEHYVKRVFLPYGAGAKHEGDVGQLGQKINSQVSEAYWPPPFFVSFVADSILQAHEGLSMAVDNQMVRKDWYQKCWVEPSSRYLKRSWDQGRSR